MEALLRSLPDSAVYSDCEYLHEIMMPPGGVRPDDRHWKRITQLAAVRVERGVVTGSFCELVRPGPPTDYPSEMWRIHEELTHLNTAAILAARTLPSVYADFVKFCGDLPLVVMLGDHEVHRRNLLEYGTDISDRTSKYTRLKPALVAVDPTTYSPLCSGELHRVVGLRAEDVLAAYGSAAKAEAHDALFDSTSMALFVVKSKEKLLAKAHTTAQVPHHTTPLLTK